MSRAQAAAALACRLRGISKSFPGVRALERVDLELRAGEIQALMGENGAGKSTLIKVLTGVEQPDEGTLELQGERARLGSPREAQARGVVAIHQESDLVATLSVAENLFLGRQPRRLGLIDHARLRQRARAACARVGLELDVRRPAGELASGTRKLLAIARALELGSRILVLDEPTSSLDAREVERLFGLLRELRERGLAILYVSHRLEEVYALCERITVLRDGRLVGSYPAEGLSRAGLVAHMLGSPQVARQPSAAGPGAREAREPPPGSSPPREHLAGTNEPGALHASTNPPREPLLCARGLGSGTRLSSCDLDLARGEIAGLAGLMGSGRSELLLLLYGDLTRSTGSCALLGREVDFHAPRAAVAAGLGLCPEDRRAAAIFPSLSVGENIAIAAQRRLSRWALLDPRAHRQLARIHVERLRVRASGLDQPAGTLSGGNQQKLVLARWLAAGPELLLLDEPTRGIDVGAREEIEAFVRELAAGGMAVLYVASSLDELLRVAERVIVLRAGRTVGELAGVELTQAALQARMAGGASHGH